MSTVGVSSVLTSFGRRADLKYTILVVWGDEWSVFKYPKKMRGTVEYLEICVP